jgi:iron complex transport system substrate-binding protein
MKVKLIRCVQLTIMLMLMFFLESMVWAQPVKQETSSVKQATDLKHANSQRLVTLGGSVTEIVYALGAGDLIIATDQSSLYPKQAQQLPSVGYYRSVPAEGVAAMRPSLVLASDHAGPPLAIKQLKALGIQVESLSDEPTMVSLQSRIRQIAHVLHQEQAGEDLIVQVNQRVAAALKIPVQSQPTMLIVMRGGKLLGAGGDTAANVVIEQSGLQNVFVALKSYQPITPEAVSVAAPEVIIVTQSTVSALGGLEKVKAQPVLMHTPAVKNNQVIVLDDLLAQGFGPRVGLAIQTIRGALGP